MCRYARPLFVPRALFLFCRVRRRAIPTNINTTRTKSRAPMRSCKICPTPARGMCAHCRGVYYCSTQCAKVDWSVNDHEHSCKASPYAVNSPVLCPMCGSPASVGASARYGAQDTATKEFPHTTTNVPPPTRAKEGPRPPLHPSKANARRRLVRDYEIMRQRKLLTEKADALAVAGQRAQREIIAHCNAFVDSISNDLPASEQPLGWDAKRARAAFAGIALSLENVWRTRAEPDAHMHMENVDIFTEELTTVLGLAPSTPVPPNHAQLMDLVAERVATHIVSYAAEQARALNVGAPRNFGWPLTDDTESANGKYHTEEEFSDDWRQQEEELAVHQAKLDAPTRTFVTKLRLAIARKISSTAIELRAWVRQKSLDVLIGFVIMGALGSLVYYGGQCALSGIYENRAAVEEQLERMGPIAEESIRDATDVQNLLQPIEETLSTAANHLSQTRFEWEKNKDIPASIVGIAVVGNELARAREIWIAQHIKLHGRTLAESARSYDAMYSSKIDLYKSLRKNFGTMPTDKFQEEWTDFLESLQTEASSYRQFTLEELTRMGASLREADNILADSKARLHELVELAVDTRARARALNAEEDIYRTRSPISAYIGHRLGQYVGSSSAGNIMWHTSKEAMWLQYMESTVNLTVEGLSEAYTNGFGAFFTATSWINVMRILTTLANSLEYGLRAGSYLLQLTAKITGTFTTLSGYIGGAALWFDWAADRIGDANTFVAIAQAGAVQASIMMSIATSLCQIYSIMISWNVAWTMGVTLVVGAGIFFTVVRVSKSPISAVGYVGRTLLTKGWLINYALIAVVYVLQYRFMGMPSPMAPGPTPMTDAIKGSSERKEMSIKLAEKERDTQQEMDRLVTTAGETVKDYVKALKDSHIFQN